jgi:hypothetical protein
MKQKKEKKTSFPFNWNMRFSWWWIWNLCSEMQCCIAWWTGIDFAEETTAFIFRVDEFTKMHSVLTGEDHRLTLWSLFNKLRNLPDMTWNKSISYRQNSWQHMSSAHYTTLHNPTLHCTCTFFQWRFWKYQHELFLGFYLALLQLWDYLVFPWEIWIIRKSF